MIGQNLGTNNGFIGRIKTELTGIRGKLNQVVQTRGAFQASLNEKQKTIDDLIKRNNTTQNVIQSLTDERNSANRQVQQLQGEIQNAQNNSKKIQQELLNARTQIDQLNRQLSEAKTTASHNQEQIEQMTREKQGLEQTIRALDGQIEQIAAVVNTQTRILDPANEGDDNNLFNHIKGINDTLNGILQMPPGMNLGPGPSPNFGNQGRPGPGPGPSFSPGGAGGNPLGGYFGSDSDSDSDSSLGGPSFGQNLNMPRRLGPVTPPLLAGQNPVPSNSRVFPAINPYQQPQVRPPFGGKKTRRKRRNKKNKKSGRKSMHKRARTKK